MNSTWQPSSFSSPGGWQPPRRPVVKTLVFINIGVFVLQIIFNDLDARELGRFSQIFGLSRDGMASGYLWQPLTYMFLHGSFFHIFANMLIIWFAGRNLEQIIGPKNFLIVYFAGGLLGGVAQLATSTGTVVGASAAGFAVLIAFTTILPELELTLLLFFILPIRMKAKYLAYAAFGISLLFVLFPPGDGIGHAAHLAGCVVGYLYARRLGHGRRSPIERIAIEKRAERARRENMPPDEFISAEIDPILEKISLHGIHSLTRAERQILERGREKIASKTSGPPR